VKQQVPRWSPDRRRSRHSYIRITIRRALVRYRLQDAFCEGFRTAAHCDSGEGTRAVVRKRPGKMLWGGGEDIASSALMRTHGAPHAEVERSEPIPDPV
jgi:hypothetical protein